MTGTAHYSLSRLTSTLFAANSWKHTEADRVLIDLLLYLGAEGHHHTGATSALVAPTLGPNLSVATTGGSMPAGVRVRYVFSWVDANGVESAPSPEAFIDTPATIATPGAGTALGSATTGGTLSPGPYFYALSAYAGASTLQTTAPAHFFVAVPLGTATNTITFTLPALPAGADGFNLYRKGPSATDYGFRATIASPTLGQTYTDTGAGTSDSTRPLPAFNTTLATNLISVGLPIGLPAGCQWRLYRTFVADLWTSSLVTTTSAVSYDDAGIATSVGEPMVGDVAPGSPSQINLATEVQGLLPMSQVGGLYATFLARSGADRPGGVALLDDAGQARLETLPGSALVGLASTFR